MREEAVSMVAALRRFSGKAAGTSAVRAGDERERAAHYVVSGE